MSNTEVSAGGIILFEKFILVIKDMHEQWTFPKGKQEPGETLLDTAKREIAEEVGIKHLTLVTELPPVSYWYTRNVPIYKTVHFFIFTTDNRYIPKPQKEEGITDAKWVEFSSVVDMIGYPDTNKPLLQQAQKYL